MKYNKSRNRIAVMAVMFIFLLTSIVFSIEDVIVLPKTGHRKPPITFSHRAHTDDYGTKCIECHHTGKNVKCSTCHTQHDRGTIFNLKGAFHQQCLGCHRKTSGPKACGRCHHSVRR